VVTFVPFAKVFVKPGTDAHTPLGRLELNCGTSTKLVLVPVESRTIFVVTEIERISLGGGGIGGGTTVITP
jgi:hypothetical protein